MELFSLFKKYKLILTDELLAYLTDANMSMAELNDILSTYKGENDLFDYIRNFKNIDILSIVVNSTEYLDENAIYIHPINFSKKQDRMVKRENIEILFKEYGNMQSVFCHLYEKYKQYKYIIIYGMIYKTTYKNIIFVNELESGIFQFDLNKFKWIL